ncbi:MAG: MarR family winged helix-turn-helix transcriptional regulator [Pseudomonadales bacterium]
MTATRKHSANAQLPAVAARPTFVIHRLNAALGRICNPRFRELGVDLITSRILVLVAERRRLQIGELVELMALPQSTVSHQIRRLEEAGLLRRRSDAQDQRALWLSLTAKGQSRADACQALSADLYGQLFADMPGAEMARLVAALADLDARLQRVESAG